MFASQNAAFRPLISGRPIVVPRSLQLRLLRVANDAEPVSRYSRQCTAGRYDAEKLIARMRTEDAPYLLGFAVTSMLLKDARLTGHQVGFFHAIAEKLL